MFDYYMTSKVFIRQKRWFFTLLYTKNKNKKQTKQKQNPAAINISTILLLGDDGTLKHDISWFASTSYYTDFLGIFLYLYV